MSEKSKQAWITGTSYDPPVKPPAFNLECERLRIDPEDLQSQLMSVELRSWVAAHKDSRFVPTELLSRMNSQTIYDSPECASYSMHDGTVIPDQLMPVEELPAEIS
jgi:hypothetical protein